MKQSPPQCGMTITVTTESYAMLTSLSISELCEMLVALYDVRGHSGSLLHHRNATVAMEFC